MVIGGNLAFGMGDGEITNQHPALENSVGNAVGNLAENSVGNSVGNLVGNSVANLAGNFVGNAVGNLVGQGGREKAYLRKAMLGENLAFGIG